MPTSFPRSPKFLKGALVSYESFILWKIPNIIVFQYNPEKVSRRLSHPSINDRESKGKKSVEPTKVTGLPNENISLTIVLDAADQLENPSTHPIAVIKGIYPALSALELLIYPLSSQCLEKKLFGKEGSTKVKNDKIPLVLFVWGPSRVVPVQIKELSVTEELFDQWLNPIQAKVDLSMSVLTHMELKEDNWGHWVSLATHIQKEVMGTLNMVNNIEQIAGMLPI